MLIVFRSALCLLILGLITSALAQSQSEKDLAIALVRIKSETEQEQLLTQKSELKNAELLVALKDLADPLVQKGEYNEALRISRLAVRIAENMGDRVQLATALCDLGAIHSRRIPPKEAFPYLQRSLALFEEAGEKKGQARVLLYMGVAYDTERRFELAVESYQKSLAIGQELGDQRVIGRNLNGLGYAYHSLDRYELSIELFQKAHAIAEQINDKELLNQVLNNIGFHYTNIGNYSAALDYLHRGLKIAQEIADTDRRGLAYKFQNIGLIYRRQGRLDQALTYARRSLELFETIDDKFGIANLQNNIGVIYKSLEQYDHALEWFDKALKNFEAVGAKPGIARSLNNIGDTYRLQGRYDEALDKLNKGLQLREEIRERNGISLSLNNLGRLYQDQGKYAEMLEVARRAEKIAEEINNREELWGAQERIGRALFALGQPEEARTYFLSSIATVEALRRGVAGGEQQQQSFLENRLSPWLGMIDLLVSQKKYAEALTFAEQSKARVLLDTLQAGRATIKQSWSKEEQQADEQHRRRLVSLNSKLTAEMRRDKPDASRVAELKAEVEKARLEYEDFETRLFSTYPDMRMRRGEAPIIKSEEVNALLPNDASAVLEYVVGENQTYLFVVTKADDVRVYTLPIKRAELIKRTEAFRRQLAGRDLGFRSSAVQLYDLLLKPAEVQLRGKSNLIISADNMLWDLPFQALVNGADRFVIQDAAIGYAPSLTVLREMTKRRGRSLAAPANLFALGNPRVGAGAMRNAELTLRDGKLTSLPEAEQEVKALGRLYGASRSKVYTGADAREDRVKSEAGRAKILHFATHGILNNASPMYSHLALAEGGAGEDGLLEAWELMQLDLKADLVVLSACETARGRIGAGEGMIGFSWAMFLAGVPSIVVSQWKVESAGTRDLMVDFHRSLIAAKAPTKAESLRRAALKLMKNPETSHPFYWAGFVLVGYGQ